MEKSSLKEFIVHQNRAAYIALVVGVMLLNPLVQRAHFPIDRKLAVFR